jgi:hypothetical protein
MKGFAEGRDDEAPIPKLWMHQRTNMTNTVKGDKLIHFVAQHKEVVLYGDLS